MREAGKTCANAVAEVREAVDFLRFYAAQVETLFGTETGKDAWAPLGPVVCISPWNFPLAIFMGQVAAALAAGNVVLAKPAEQTPLVAAEAVRILHGAGVPRAAVQLLPGQGETVGARLVGDGRVMGVLFTGSTDVARILQRSVAGRLDATGRPVPLIAETGGQNAMIVDSSALAEQVVADAVASAFDSAGQRCSALRVLCLQEDVADRVLEMLRGAMAELRIGRPDQLATDVGPVIDAEARDGILRHVAALRERGRAVHQVPVPPHAGAEGTYVPPTLIELKDLSELEREVFGPVLHVVRYPRSGLDTLLDRIAGTGYGLTQGLHTRIDETVERVLRRARAGNLYVNRNMVGAVVGVQPFGGEGLSGTGPKAGGPLYLLRLVAQAPGGAARAAIAAMAAPDTGEGHAPAAPAPLQALADWARSAGQGRAGSGLPPVRAGHAGRQPPARCPAPRESATNTAWHRANAFFVWPMPMRTGCCSWPPCWPWTGTPSGLRPRPRCALLCRRRCRSASCSWRTGVRPRWPWMPCCTMAPRHRCARCARRWPRGRGRSSASRAMRPAMPRCRSNAWSWSARSASTPRRPAAMPAS